MLPELRLHLASEITPLWEASEEALAEKGVPPPFWAFAWAGGQALARYLLDHPEAVRGKTVLDFASGSGLSAIAAAKAGAKRVIANEIDAFAVEAIRLNAELNGVELEIEERDLVGESDPAWQVVIAGDVCYEKTPSERFMLWLRALSGEGREVLMGDPLRTYLPRSGLERVIAYSVKTTREIEDSDLRNAVVWRVSRPAPLTLQLAAEQQFLVRVHGQPGVLLDFRIELSGPPTGVTQRQHLVARPLVLRDVAQHLERGRQGDPLGHLQRPVVKVVGGVQHEATAGFHRAAILHLNVLGGGELLDLKLFQHLGKGNLLHRPVHHQAHGPVLVVGAKEDQAALKARIGHGRHGDEHLACQVAVRGAFHLSPASQNHPMAAWPTLSPAAARSSQHKAVQHAKVTGRLALAPKYGKPDLELFKTDPY